MQGISISPFDPERAEADVLRSVRRVTVVGRHTFHQLERVASRSRILEGRTYAGTIEERGAEAQRPGPSSPIAEPQPQVRDLTR